MQEVSEPDDKAFIPAANPIYKTKKFLNFKLPEKECTIYKIKKEYAEKLTKRKTSDKVMFSYFLLSCASLSAY